MRTILVCCDTGCRAKGAYGVVEALQSAIDAAGADANVEASIKTTGCHGLCEQGPLVRIMPDDIAYYHVAPADAEDIVASLDGQPVERLLYGKDDGSHVVHQAESPFYTTQRKIALRNVGLIDPSSIDDYLAAGGYDGLRRALEMTPDQIISAVEASGIRGRGGAGFPTGRKWRSAAGYDNTPKYVVCNGDEGDPGAFMDRAIMEGDPHSIVEGMAICALAIGAEEGFLYIRDEYDSAIERLRAAMAQAEERGFIGDSMLGTDHRLHLSLVRGGGAYVCGESTALMASIEGKVGEPRAKYIRSVERGVWDKPTVLNNVETWANIPVILRDGPETVSSVGTEKSTGTKVFSLVGKVERTGLVEVPMGIILRDLIYDIGGGIKDGRPFKAVQTGGPSGGCIPESLLDLPVDFDSLSESGAIMGSGGMIIMDDRSCMVDIARYYVDFLCEESCGKCTPCREGLRQMQNILTDICEGRGTMEQLDLLEQLGETMQEASLCSLGRSAPNAVNTTMRFFRDEYVAHIVEHRCPGGICRDLTAFRIDDALCTSCGACKTACPADAITVSDGTYTINQDVCIVCGECREACHDEAVLTEGRQA